MEVLMDLEGKSAACPNTTNFCVYSMAMETVAGSLWTGVEIASWWTACVYFISAELEKNEMSR